MLQKRQTANFPPLYIDRDPKGILKASDTYFAEIKVTTLPTGNRMVDVFHHPVDLILRHDRFISPLDLNYSYVELTPEQDNPESRNMIQDLVNNLEQNLFPVFFLNFTLPEGFISTFIRLFFLFKNPHYLYMYYSIKLTLKSLIDKIFKNKNLGVS